MLNTINDRAHCSHTDRPFRIQVSESSQKRVRTPTRPFPTSGLQREEGCATRRSLDRDDLRPPISLSNPLKTKVGAIGLRELAV
jgi:hypothetical protein